MRAQLLLRYHVARVRWIWRTSDLRWGFTHPGLVVRTQLTASTRRLGAAVHRHCEEILRGVVSMT